MLDEPGNATDQSRNAQLQDNADQHSDMQVEIYISLMVGVCCIALKEDIE